MPRVAAHFGQPVTLLVNNASCFRAEDAAVPGMDALVRHFAVNAAAPFALAAAVAAQAAPEGACVINMLDERIVQPPADQLAYTISKQALAEVTRTLAYALKPGVRVNGVAPGLTIPTADYTPSRWRNSPASCRSRACRNRTTSPMRCCSWPVRGRRPGRCCLWTEAPTYAGSSATSSISPATARTTDPLVPAQDQASAPGPAWQGPSERRTN